MAVYNYIENANWGETTSGTTLTLNVPCDVGDTIVAFVTTRSSATFSAGWTVVAETPIFSTSSQRLFCLQKVATGTNESITVSQGSSGRIYIELLTTKAMLGSAAFVNQTGGLTNDYDEANASKQNITDVVLWGVSINLYKTSSPYGKISISPSENTVLYSSGIDNQDRQAVFWDNNSNALERKFNFPAGSTPTGYGLLGITLIPTYIAYSLATDGTDTYAFTGTKWEVVMPGVTEPDVQAFLDYGVFVIPNFEGLPADCHLLIYDPEQENKQYALNIESNPPDQVVTMKSGIALSFGTTAEEPTITVATDGGGTAVMTDWKQTGNKVKVEITMSKPDRNATASVSEIKVPFHKGS